MDRYTQASVALSLEEVSPHMSFDTRCLGVFVFVLRESIKK